MDIRIKGDIFRIYLNENQQILIEQSFGISKLKHYHFKNKNILKNHPI